MFVRHIDEKRTETLYECDSVAIKDCPSDEGEPGVMVTMTSDLTREMTLFMPKQGNELYVMNNNGRTIDSYRWSEYDGPPVAVVGIHESLTPDGTTSRV